MKGAFPTVEGFEEAPTMLSSAQILAGICEFAELAARENVTIALCGGAAMHAYGNDRLTSDIDFVSVSYKQLGNVEGGLTFGGYATRTPSGIPVDVIVPEAEYAELYTEAQMRAVAVDGMPVRVVTAEHLAAMKMVARREKDHLDLVFLVTAKGFDRRKARSIIKKHLGTYAAEEFDGLCEEADWRKVAKK